MTHALKQNDEVLKTGTVDECFRYWVVHYSFRRVYEMIDDNMRIERTENA